MVTKKRVSPRLPRGLGRDTRGGRLWRDVTAEYDLRADELVVLEMAARQTNLSERFAAEIEKKPLIVRGSKGQDAPHPLLQELRASRHVVAQMLRQLQLPDDVVGNDLATGLADARQRSVSARAAAMHRWGRNG